MYISPLLTHIQTNFTLFLDVPLVSCVQYFNFVNSFLGYVSIKTLYSICKRFTLHVLSGQTGFVPGHLVQEVSSSSSLRPVSPVHFNLYFIKSRQLNSLCN